MWERGVPGGSDMKGAGSNFWTFCIHIATKVCVVIRVDEMEIFALSIVPPVQAKNFCDTWSDLLVWHRTTKFGTLTYLRKVPVGLTAPRQLFCWVQGFFGVVGYMLRVPFQLLKFLLSLTSRRRLCYAVCLFVCLFIYLSSGLYNKLWLVLMNFPDG